MQGLLGKPWSNKEGISGIYHKSFFFPEQSEHDHVNLFYKFSCVHWGWCMKDGCFFCQKFGVDTHYRSAIFYENEEERKQAQESKVRQQMKLNRRIVTKILPRHSSTNSGFYLAESHHQKYYLQRYHVRLCECLNLRSAEQFAGSHLACKLNGFVWQSRSFFLILDSESMQLIVTLQHYDIILINLF